MVSDEPQNNNSHQGESVESITLASLLENPDPDFDVVVKRRVKDKPGWLERAKEAIRPSPPNGENKQA